MFDKLLGKKLVALRGVPRKPAYHNKIVTELGYILFEDGWIMELDKQDPYDYHDCSSSARDINIYQSQELWQRMFDKDGFQEPDSFDL